MKAETSIYLTTGAKLQMRLEKRLALISQCLGSPVEKSKKISPLSKKLKYHYNFISIKNVRNSLPQQHLRTPFFAACVKVKVFVNVFFDFSKFSK